MGRVLERSNPVSTELQKVFASYHWSDIIKNQQGFGNIVLAISPELYAGKIDKLIADITKQIKLIIDDRLKVDSDVEVLFFR